MLHQVVDHPANIRFRCSIAVVISYAPGGKPKAFIPTSCRAGSTMSATVDTTGYPAFPASSAAGFFFPFPAPSCPAFPASSAAGFGAGTVG